MKSPSIILDKNKLIISGFITFDNIVQTLNSCIEKTKNIETVEIDFKNLYKSNSSVLLFIINYIKYALKTNKQIFFMNIPPLLIELSKVYNLNNIIQKKVKTHETNTNR